MCMVNESKFKRVYSGESLLPLRALVHPAFLPSQKQPLCPGSFVSFQLVFEKGLCRDFQEAQPSFIPSAQSH